MKLHRPALGCICHEASVCTEGCSRFHHAGCSEVAHAKYIEAQAEVIKALLKAAKAVITDNGLNSDNAAGLRDAIEAAEKLERLG